MVDAEPNWYENPENEKEWRWWDGQDWTDHTSPKAEVLSEANELQPSQRDFGYDPFTGASTYVPNFHHTYQSNIFSRVIARMVDSLIITLPLTLVIYLYFGFYLVSGNIWNTEFEIEVQNILTVVLGLVITFAQVIYEVLFYKYKSATPGKMLMGLIVVDDSSREPIAYSDNAWLVRGLAYTLLSFPFIGGLISIINALLVFFNPHQSVMDRLANTKVVRK